MFAQTQERENPGGPEQEEEYDEEDGGEEEEEEEEEEQGHADEKSHMKQMQGDFSMGSVRKKSRCQK